jgi:hypothetical protein
MKEILQNDNLSPLWFYLDLKLRSSLLTKTGYGFTIQQMSIALNKQSDVHGWYQILRLYWKAYTALNRTDTFSKNINMSFAPDKSKTMCVSQGNFTLKDFRYDWTNWDTHTHIYLGLLLARQTKHKDVKYNSHSCIHKEINTCTWVLT